MSLIKNLFRDQIPRWISRFPKVPSSWGPELQRLEGHSDWVWAVAFSRDGQLLASASTDRTVRLWNPATGEQTQRLEGHGGPVWAVAFSRDGQLLASASNDRTVRLWNPATGEQHEIGRNIAGVYELHFCDRRSLETNKGVLPLPSSLCSIETLDPESAEEVVFHDDWIMKNEENFLWLPIEYRGCLAARDSLFVMGGNSGLVNFIEFSFK